VVFEAALRQAMGDHSQTPTVRVARIQKDSRPFELAYQPGHPDADAKGMVALPNIKIHEEMADMIVASRAFEANLTVIRTARNMAAQSWQSANDDLTPPDGMTPSPPYPP